ncbi:coagulation factor XIII A chain [Cynoglossus semilaevis]|uniref:protein-glutamine gamma-glutamyltransferase n=1 Tax=Cynoglossus semilaevis TaxID=244447 RepID=A0A3P8WSR0_CYNSE|nr:coagulation factor XIII A chain [Cynoglossus semilaevis]
MSRNENKNQGRFQEPNSNLGAEEDDFLEFEPFPDVEVEAGPRTLPSGALQVEHVDMNWKTNAQVHHTYMYNTNLLVVRRGTEFLVTVTFNQPLTQQDTFKLEFLIGSDPAAHKCSRVSVEFGPNAHQSTANCWLGNIIESQGNSVTLGITPTPTAIVGKFRTYVAIRDQNGWQITKRNSSTDLYLLFNPWSPEDSVFLNNDSARFEYVLNDTGVIYQGTVDAVSQRYWSYGQFEQGVLDACIYILDACHMPISERGNVVKVIRQGSSIINAQDDNGVLVGNWSDNYTGGTAPTSWTGSANILLKYVQTGMSVCYAQCWVFAGVFNTFLRSLGIPARVITNFSSAHDNTGNLKIDLIFKMDGTPDRRNTRDSIWNYHCWNEVYMVRHDLPAKYGGWQVVDATPQETSDGYYRCGPASVNAIKEGEVCYPFDSGFCFAEVNSDVVCMKRDRYGNLSPYYVDKTMVGQAVYTKSITGNEPEDITGNYKDPEGSQKNADAVARAESYGMSGDHSELETGMVTVVITVEQNYLGGDVILSVDFHNSSNSPASVNAVLTGWIINYTGYPGPECKHESFAVTVEGQNKKREVLKTMASEYMHLMSYQPCLYFTVTGTAGDQSLTAVKVVHLQTPTLTITVYGVPQVNQNMFATVTFTNPFQFDLEDVTIAMEGAGVMESKTHSYKVISTKSSVTWSEAFTPRLSGLRCIHGVLDSKKLSEVYGYVAFTVYP